MRRQQIRVQEALEYVSRLFPSSHVRDIGLLSELGIEPLLAWVLFGPCHRHIQLFTKGSNIKSPKSGVIVLMEARTTWEPVTLFKSLSKLGQNIRTGVEHWGAKHGVVERPNAR